MSLQQLEHPPPYSHNATEIQLPSPPKHELLTGDRASPRQASPPLSIAAKGSQSTKPSSASNALPSSGGKEEISGDTVLHANQLPDVPLTSPGAHPNDQGMVIDHVPQRRDTTLSAEDLIVAEALTDLRQFGSPPPVGSPVAQSRATITSPRQASSGQEPEPLLSLLKTSHPWLGGTIDGSLSAYSVTKSHSPRFVQYGANFVERNIGTPVASTVESVGRKTGVGGRLRNYLDSRRPSDIEGIDRQKFDESSTEQQITATSDDAMDVDGEDAHESRRLVSSRTSIESLPAYDETRSPPYEQDLLMSPNRSQPTFQRGSINRSWSRQLIITTSGLGVALSESSLRSLKYCFGILRTANNHVQSLMQTLKRLLGEYEQSFKASRQRGQNADPEIGANNEDMMDLDSAEAIAPTALAERIKKLNEEIWKTLKTVVDSVSRYTGGALPDRASELVRLQLLSVPQRWRRAVTESVPINESQPASDTISNAHRMLAFAREGLDMMARVGEVVESTIVSAERWLDTMGRRREDLPRDSKEQPSEDAPILDSKESS